MASLKILGVAHEPCRNPRWSVALVPVLLMVVLFAC
jgi:hypothetical protein